MENRLEQYAVLWDMDGVLVDNGELHYLSWKQALAEEGVSFTWEMFLENFGMNNDSTVKIILGEDVDMTYAGKIMDRKEVLFREMVKGHAIILPGVRDWLARFRDWGMRQAVASSAPIENINVLMDELDLRQYFDALVSGGDLPGKPQPDVFLKAARKVAIPPERCLVIEDAVHGVEGAKSAGMTCLAVTTSNPAEALQKADLVLENLTRLDANMVKGLLQEG